MKLKRIGKTVGAVLLLLTMALPLAACGTAPVKLEPNVIRKEIPEADLCEAPGSAPDAALAAEAETLFAGATVIDAACATFDGEEEGVCLLSYDGPRDVTALILPRVVDGKPVTRIASGALAGCDALAALSTPLPGDQTLAALFEEREGGVLSQVPATLRFLTVEGDLPDFAAAGCRSLVRVELKNATRLGNYALWECVSLRSVVLPEGLTFAGEEALAHTALDTVTLPASLSECGLGLLRGCDALRELTMPVLPGLYLGFVFGARDVAWSAAFMPGDLWSVSLTAGTAELPAYALTGCTARFVNLGEGMTDIGIRAFADCPNLRKVILPPTLRTIGDDAFFGDLRLSQIELPDALTSIGDRAFYDCVSLNEINLPVSLQRVGSLAFAGCPAGIEIITCY